MNLPVLASSPLTTVLAALYIHYCGKEHAVVAVFRAASCSAQRCSQLTQCGRPDSYSGVNMRVFRTHDGILALMTANPLESVDGFDFCHTCAVCFILLRVLICVPLPP